MPVGRYLHLPPMTPRTDGRCILWPRDEVDEACDRIAAVLDGRDYTELERPEAQWQRWAYYAAKGECHV